MLHMSQDELAKRLGYKSRSSVNKMELGIQDVPQKKIKDIAKALGCTIGYLLEDDKYAPDAKSNIERLAIRMNPVPIYDPISCGTGAWVDEQPTDYIGIPDSMMSKGVQYFANPAGGDSMEPLIHDGDYLVFEKAEAIDPGRIGSFALNGEYYCKRLKRMPDGSCWLFSENSKYDPIPIYPGDDFRTLGLYRIKVSKEQ